VNGQAEQRRSLSSLARGAARRTRSAGRYVRLLGGWCDPQLLRRITCIHATLHGSPKPSPRYADATFRLGFARLVTHFFGQHAFLPPDGISGRIDRIADVPAVFVRGRLDIASPLGVVWRLAQQLPLATLHVVEDEDHGGADITDQLVVQATNRFAERTGLPTRQSRHTYRSAARRASNC